MKRYLKIAILLILQLFCIQQNSSAQDTVRVIIPVKHKFSPSPMKATMLAVVFPGAGQIYNRKYLKVPVVYGGFATLIYFAKFNGSKYKDYMSAYHDFTDKIPETRSYLKIITGAVDTYPPKDPISQYSASDYAYIKDRLLNQLDYFKRYRDLSYIGIVGWYMISILDANVDASLFNYDVSNNLDIAVFPSQVYLPGGFTGAGINVGLSITF